MARSLVRYFCVSEYVLVMEPVELVIPTAITGPNLMGSDGVVGATATGVGDAESCDTGRGLVFSSPKIEKCSASVSHREYNANGLESSSWMKKAERVTCRNTIQLSASDSLVLAAGSEGKQLQKKERRTPRSSPGCFKIPQAPRLETSMSASEDVDMKDVPDELRSHMIKSSYAEKCQPLKLKNNLNGRRGDRKNARAPLNAKYDGLAGFRPTPGGNKVFGAYGLKADVYDITKVIDDISLNEVLDGSYKCPIVAKEKGKRAADTSENILHLVRKAFSILQPHGFSRVNKQCDEIDVSFTKELSSLPTSNLSMASNLIGEEDSSAASDLSYTKGQESCANTEAPSSISNLPLYHPRDVIEKLAIPPSKDLDSLLQDASKPATFSRCNEPRPGKPLSRRAALSTYSWSHNHSSHSKTNSDSVKVSSRSSCQGRWIRIGKTATFLEGGTKYIADLDSLAYDSSLVPSGSVKYILPKTQETFPKVSLVLSSQQASSSLIWQPSSPSPPDLHSPKEMKAAQALYDIANETANGIIKWPKQPSQKAMKARKSKSIPSPENLLTPESEVALGNTVRLIDCSTPLKKPKLLSSEKKDHSFNSNSNAPRPPHFWSAPKSNKSSSIRASREPINGSAPKPLFMAPPRRASDKINHSQEKKLRKVMQMDWKRGKGQL